MSSAVSERTAVHRAGANSSATAIVVRDLWKRYGPLEAVRGINFSVERGEIFGLIGADGAGKTTTFQILAGVMEATKGSAEIFGIAARDARSQTGYLTQAFSLYLDLSVMENIRYVGQLRHVTEADIAERGQRYLRAFDMDRFSSRLAGQLSGGMKQKLALVCALVAEPHILLLDEPTTGVDPVSRREFWDTVAHLAGEGLTVVVATPYLDEAERCHRIALIHQGEIRQIGTPEEIRGSLNARRLELRTPQLQQALQAISRSQHTEIFDLQRFGDRLDLLSHDAARAQADVQRIMEQNHLAIDDLHVDEPTLENTFVATLRALGERTTDEPFPSRHLHRNLRGQVAIGARGLTKQFGSFTAVHDVSLQVNYGEIYGLLGANGAGKTTTIKMLCGLLEATHGSMQLAGQAEAFRSMRVRQQIGYMSQKFSLYDDLTIEENLQFFAGVYGVSPEEQQEKERWVLQFSGLEGKQHQLTGSLPGGWKQRVAFGSAIMHEPGIVFLDEPTSGVDPLARRAFWSMINHLADSGTAVLVTTHYLEEAEQCNRLGLMVAGELLLEGTPSEIKAQQKGHLLEFRVDQTQRAADLLKSDTGHWRVSIFGRWLHVISDDSADVAIRATREKLESAGIRVLEAREGRFSLEDVFISVVEHARQQGKFASED
ncbi:MAG TPA: ATP-binding cassette domain-containing protein [Verrucomicrobiae bacterium]|nr:ATP-binding cassette domain-containing protein [Verrucomicrobiae bacterium]